MRAALIALLSVCALVAHTAQLGQRYEFRAVLDADGIGKFYLGREIAQVMGPGGILWLERAERASEEQPELAIDALDIEPAMLEAIAQRTKREQVGNVATVRSSAQDPNLAPGSVDLLFMVDVYRELQAAGFRHVKTVRTLPLQHLIVFAADR